MRSRSRGLAVVDGTRIPEEVAVKRHWGRWITALVILVLVVGVVDSLVKNPQMKWSVIGEYFFDPLILTGLWQTILLAVVSMACALVVGILFAFFTLSRNPVLKGVSWVYLWVSRSVPALIQILIWGNFALFSPWLGIPIPGTSIVLFQVSTNTVLTPFTASVVALTFATGGYLAEIFRSGILSVPEGQKEAAAALGLTWGQIQARVILPQAMRVIVPPAGNEFISVLKTTSLVAVIAGGDILGKAQNIASYNLRTMEMLIIASLWYLIVTSLATVGQHFLERRINRGRGGI